MNKRVESFAVALPGTRAVALFPRDGAEVSDRAGDPPSVAEQTKRIQRRLIKPCGVIPKFLITRDSALVILRPGAAQAVAGSIEYFGCFVVQATCLVVLLLLSSYECEIGERTRIPALIAGLTPRNEASLEVVGGAFKIAEIGKRNSERVVSNGHAREVAASAMKGETHLGTKNRLVVIALRRRENAQSKKSSRTQAVVQVRGGELEECCQPSVSLGKMFRPLPEVKESESHPQAPLRVAGFEKPVQGRSEIIVF